MQATILLALQSMRLPFLTQLAALVSALGNYAFVWIILGLVMIFFTSRQNVGITVMLTVIIAGLLCGFVLQPAFGQIRPNDAGIGVSAVMGVSRSGYSMPSFHATTSFAAAMVIAMIGGRKWGTWSFVAAFFISLSRLYLGVEWPLDVLVGAAIGVVIGIIMSWVYNQVLHDMLLNYQSGARAKAKRSSVSAGGAQRRKK